MNSEPNSQTRRIRFKLSTLLAVLTIAAIGVAWYADHSRLMKIIGEPKESLMVVYYLQNASSQLVADKLNELYEGEQRIAVDPKTNSLIVSAEKPEYSQIKELVKYYDRPDTDLVRSPNDAAAPAVGPDLGQPEGVVE